MKFIVKLFDLPSQTQIKTEVLSGITVAMALIPEAVAFSLIAGLPPLTGLYAAIVMGLVTSLIGGRPGMISGATGAIAILIAPLAASHGIEYVYATVILAGLIQLTVGLLKGGKLIRLVPQPVVYGFVNGLAIIIFLSQMAQFKTASGAWMTGSPLFFFGGLVLLTMLVIWGLPKLTKAIPASLTAILLVFALVSLFGLDTKTIGDLASIRGSIPPFHLPNLTFSLETLQIILPYAGMVAAVGLIESLLTMNIIDEITQTRGRGNKEAIAQGTANIFSGFLSGMGGCAMIGQSLINISNGARARLSGITASVMLLIFVVFASEYLEQVPMAALTGLMIMVSIGTFEWASLGTLTKMPKSDVFVMVLVTVVTLVFHNLALAVLLGVIIAALVFAWDNAKRIRARKYVDEQGIKHYEIYGPLFFGSIAAFNEKFIPEEDPDTIVLDFAESRVTDMSAIEALSRLTERYHRLGKTVHLKHLSQDCRQLLNNASGIIDVNVMEDPTYKVMTNRL
ncbi:MAG: SulP family inorganic anion transporter [Bacteroidales bacterium]|nr:SulP family inorganic anion transporter [Bacteroidales bacterium]